MGYRIITKNGESYINDISILISLAKSNIINSESKIYDTDTDLLRRASDFKELVPYFKKSSSLSTNYNIYEYDFDDEICEHPHHHIRDIIFYIFSAIIISFGLLLVYWNILNYLQFEGSTDLSYNSGFIIGGLAFYIAIAVMGITITNKQNSIEDGAKKILNFSIIYIFLIFCAGMGSYRIISEKCNTQLESTNKEVISMLNDFYSNNTITTKEFNQSNYGPYSIFLSLHQDWLINLKNDSVSRDKELTSLNLDNLFVIQTFYNNTSISNGQKKINEAIKILDKHINTFNARLSKYIDDINNTNLPNSFKESYLSAFQKSGSDRIIKYFELYKESLIKYNAVLEYVKSYNGKYYISSEKLMFNNQNILNGYNALLSEFQTKYKEFNAYQVQLQIRKD